MRLNKHTLKFLVWLVKSPYEMQYQKLNGLEYLIFADYSKCYKQGLLGFHSSPITQPVRKGFEEVYKEFLKE